MKKLTLRAEHLGELSPADLRNVAAAAGGAAPDDWTISDGSCVCTFGEFKLPLCDISAGSCVCTIDVRTVICTVMTR